MNCINATSPVNIVKATAGKCDLKCSVTFNYGTTSVRAENKGDFIRLAFDPENKPPVIFNAQKYVVQEARIFQPSLHTFNGQHTAAELIITHQNQSSNQNLLVCVPISGSGSASGTLDTILKQVAQKANTKGSSTNISSSSFSIKQLVPNKPFFNYVGTLPYSPCNGSYEYIVFDKGNAITITDSALLNLAKVVTPAVYATHTPVGGLFYNSTGPGTLTDGDDIYIECNPTGDDGSILVGAPKGGSSSGGTGGSSANVSNAWETLKNSGLLTAFIALIALFVLIKIFTYVFAKLTAKSGGGSVDAGAADASGS